MRFGKRSKNWTAAGRRWLGERRNAEENAVASAERSALLEPQEEEEDVMAPPPVQEEPVLTGDPTQHLLTALGRFQRQVAKAEGGAPPDAWTDECMAQLIRGIEIALAQDWEDVQEAMTDTARILQSYEDGGNAAACTPFLQDSYEILCLMVGDLIVDNVRSGVIQKWRNRYQLAVEELLKAGLQLVDDEEGETASVSAPEVLDNANEEVESPLPEEPVEAIAESPFEAAPSPFEDAELEEDTVFEAEVSDTAAQEEEVPVVHEAVVESPFESPDEMLLEEDIDTSELPSLDEMIAAPIQPTVSEPSVEEETLEELEEELEPPVLEQVSVQEEVEDVEDEEVEDLEEPDLSEEFGALEASELSESPGVFEESEMPETEDALEEITLEDAVQEESTEAALTLEMAESEGLDIEEVEQEEEMPLVGAVDDDTASLERAELQEAGAEEYVEMEGGEELAEASSTLVEEDSSSAPVEVPEKEGAEELEPLPVEETAPVAIPVAETSLESLLQSAIATGNVAEAKLLALKLAAQMAQLEAEKIQQTVQETQTGLSEDDKAIIAAQTEVENTTQRLKELGETLARREEAFQQQRQYIDELRGETDTIEGAIHELQEQIQALQKQIDDRVSQLNAVQDRMEEARAEEEHIQNDLDTLAEEEVATRMLLEEAQQQVTMLQKKRAEDESKATNAEGVLRRQLEAVADIERTLGQIEEGGAGSLQENPDDTLLF